MLAVAGVTHADFDLTRQDVLEPRAPTINQWSADPRPEHEAKDILQNQIAVVIGVRIVHSVELLLDGDQTRIHRAGADELVEKSPVGEDAASTRPRRIDGQANAGSGIVDVMNALLAVQSEAKVQQDARSYFP